MTTKEKLLKESQAQLLAMEGMKPAQAVALNPEPKEPKTEAPKAKPATKLSKYKRGIDPKNLKSMESKRNKLLLSLRDSDREKLERIAQSLETSLNEAVAILIDEYKIKKR